MRSISSNKRQLIVPLFIMYMYDGGTAGGIFLSKTWLSVTPLCKSEFSCTMDKNDSRKNLNKSPTFSHIWNSGMLYDRFQISFNIGLRIGRYKEIKSIQILQ